MKSVRHNRAVLTVPDKHKDGEWATKISIAKKARLQAQKSRKGKPLVLKTRREMSS